MGQNFDDYSDFQQKAWGLWNYGKHSTLKLFILSVLQIDLRNLEEYKILFTVIKEKKMKHHSKASISDSGPSTNKKIIFLSSLNKLSNVLITNTGDPLILRFQNSWSPLFCDSVSGPNFVNSPPFHDFQKKFKNIFSNFYKKLMYIFCCCVLFSMWILRFPS